MTTTITGSVGGIICDQQTWQNVKASRAAGTTYTNSTGRPIFVSVVMNTNSASTPDVILTIDGVIVAKATTTGVNGATAFVGGIVPNGSTYLITFAGASAVLTYWAELR